jgi:ribose 5-phosphate isomerase A
VGKALEKMGATIVLRPAVRKAGPVITEHGNLILDIRFASAPDPVAMEREINQIPGVVENGFFTRTDPVIYIARSDGTIEVRQKSL